jgi:hypothetical protein
MRGKIHSSLGGSKAYLSFELKDHDRRRRRRYAPSLTSKLRYARGQPCDEWEAAAGAAVDYARQRCGTGEACCRAEGWPKPYAPPHICSESLKVQPLCVRKLVVR